MKVITFITQKGGSGKTTTLLNLAAYAAQKENTIPIVVDLDPQRSTMAWWQSRDMDNVGCVDIAYPDLQKALQTMEAKGVKYVFIDTPARAESINNIAIKFSDFCILPCQPSLLDMRAAKATVDSINVLNKKGAFIVTRASPRGYRVDDAANALKVHGLPVCPYTIVDRAAYRDSYAEGKSVNEYEPNGKAAQEISEIWEWVSKILNKKMELAA